MTGAQDTFRRFVDWLSDHLDDQMADGQLAAPLYLSRFHFDRLVSAVSGETPGRFRRRVRLERAAYRLVTSDWSVLEVAIEAGYTSHEGFTRAFHRAYDAAPAAWRAAPGPIQIDAPNGVHFHPPGSLRLPAERKVTTMDLLTRMLEHHVWLTGEMIDRAHQLPAAELDKPIVISVDSGDPDSIRLLLSRLVGQMDMWNCAIEGGSYDWAAEERESLDAMRERLGRVGHDFLRHLGEVAAAGRLDETFVDATCEPAEVFSYAGMIAHVLTFAAHRRTLVTLALKRAGISDLGWGDPMKWVAEAA